MLCAIVPFIHHGHGSCMSHLLVVSYTLVSTEACISLLLFVQVVDIVEVRHVALNDLLRSLNLRGNPLRELPDYRLSVIFAVHQLTELDTQRIDIAEKVS